MGHVAAPGEGVFEYGHGAAVDIAAAADANHHFVNWTGTGVAAGKVDCSGHRQYNYNNGWRLYGGG